MPEFLSLSVSLFVSWTVVWFFPLCQRLTSFLLCGLSDNLMYRIRVSEKSRSQLNSNLLRETPSNFSSDALITRPWLHDGRFLICVGYCMFNCCVSFYFLKVLLKNHFFESFRSVDKFSNVDRKHPNSGRFNLELDGPIWFLFSCPQHSATTAFQNL